MEEERFELLEEELEYAIRDNISKNKRIYYVNAWDFDDLRMLLNQQDKEIKQLKQSTRQLAINELKKLKDYFCEEYVDDEGYKTNDREITKDGCEIANEIDNQIKDLEGKVYEIKKN